MASRAPHCYPTTSTNKALYSRSTESSLDSIPKPVDARLQPLRPRNTARQYYILCGTFLQIPFYDTYLLRTQAFHWELPSSFFDKAQYG